MLFVDLEPKGNNKEMYNLTHINNAIVNVTAVSSTGTQNPTVTNLINALYAE